MHVQAQRVHVQAQLRVHVQAQLRVHVQAQLRVHVQAQLRVHVQAQLRVHVQAHSVLLPTAHVEARAQGDRASDRDSCPLSLNRQHAATRMTECVELAEAPITAALCSTIFTS